MVKKILGVPIVALVFSLMIIGGASAALVSYLSNSAVVNVAVDSPLIVQVAPEIGGTWELTQDFGTVYGGDTVAWRTRVENRADAPITGNLVATIDNGIWSASCNDFTSLRFYDPGAANWTDVIDTPRCVDAGGRAVVTIPVAYTNSEVEIYPAEMTFDPAVMPANYSLTSQVMV